MEKNLTLYFDERDKETKKLLIDTDSYDLEDETQKKVITKDLIHEYMDKYKLGRNFVTITGKCKLRQKSIKKMNKQIYEYELKNNIEGGLFF